MNRMFDYEDLILQRQENIEIWEDGEAWEDDTAFDHDVFLEIACDDWEDDTAFDELFPEIAFDDIDLSLEDK